MEQKWRSSGRLGVRKFPERSGPGREVIHRLSPRHYVAEIGRLRYSSWGVPKILANEKVELSLSSCACSTRLAFRVIVGTIPS